MNLIEALTDLLSTEGPHIIAIDGPAGAGKTTLADEIKRALGHSRSISVIHLDDIYEGWDGALGESLTENLSRIVAQHFLQKPFQIDIYDWSTSRFGSVREMDPAEILIIEGVGSAQEVIRQKALATIWIEIDRNLGLERVIARDGEEIRSQMQAWQTAEDNHFAISKAAELADFVITTA